MQAERNENGYEFSMEHIGSINKTTLTKGYKMKTKSKSKSNQAKLANKQAKRLRKIKALKASVKELTEQFRADLRVATAEEFQAILDKLTNFKGSAMNGVNKDFRLSDEQQADMALHIIDIEEELNSKEGRKMVEDSLANAERIKSFKISDARKGTDEITASASWIVGKDS